MNRTQQGDAAWRTLRDVQNNLLAIVEQNGGRLTPSTLAATYNAKHETDVLQLLNEIRDILDPELRSRFPNAQSFGHQILAQAAIGRTLEV